MQAARRRGRRILRPPLRRDAARQLRRSQHSQSAQTAAAQRCGRGAARRLARQSSSPCARRRMRPGLDDKVLADWNGMMIAALANASVHARRTAMDRRSQSAPSRFIARDDDERRPARPFLARGQAQISRPRFRLRGHDPRRACAHEATGRAELSRPGGHLAACARPRLCRGRNGTYYLTAADAEGLVIRPAATTDEATPNHNAVAAQNLIRLALVTGDDRWREKADRLIAAIAPAGGREPLHAHGAVQRHRSAASRRRDRGDRARAPALMRCSPQRVPYRLSTGSCSHARSADALPPSHPAQAQVRAASRAAGLRLCRGNLLAAGDRSGRA